MVNTALRMLADLTAYPETAVALIAWALALAFVLGGVLAAVGTAARRRWRHWRVGRELRAMERESYVAYRRSR